MLVCNSRVELDFLKTNENEMVYMWLHGIVSSLLMYWLLTFVYSRQVTSGGKKSGDVLSEIDNMLQGLTDELDAMLEIDMDE